MNTSLASDRGTEREPPSRISYGAFLSYSHSADRQLALTLQQALHRFARRPFTLRAVRVFCDTASLGANAALWPAIENALAASRYLIVMASPQAAASPWVEREIDYWRRHKPAQNLMIALTAGDIVWDDATRSFDWSRTTALPRAMHGLFAVEPLWVDLRWIRDADRSWPGHPRFRDCVADLAAPLHGRPKDDLIGEDIRHARRIRWLTASALTLLTLLTVALGWMVVEAERRRQVAADERDRALQAESRYLADAALRQMAEGQPERGVLLALEALPDADRPRPYVASAEAALFAVLGRLGAKRVATLDFRPYVSTADFSPDAARLVTTDAGDTARVWDAENGKLLLELKGHQGPLWSSAFSPDGRLILTASVDRSVRLWDAADGRLLRVFVGHEQPVLQAVMSADQKLVAAASADATARVWEASTGTSVATLRGHAAPLCCVQFNRDASRLITASIDGTARLWSADGRVLATFRDVPRRFSSVAGTSVVATFSPDGQFVATSHDDDSLRIWSAVDGAPVTTLGHSGEVTDAVFSSDSRLLVTVARDGTARLWRISPALLVFPTGELRSGERRAQRPSLNSVAITGESDLLVTAGDDALRLWDASDGVEIAALSVDTPVRAVTMSRDGRRLAAIHTSVVSLWEVASTSFTRWRTRLALERIDPAERPVTVLKAKTPNLSSTDNREWEPPMAIAADGKTGAAITGRSVVLWALETGTTIATIAAHARVVSQVSFHPAGDRLLTVSYDGSAKIWDARSGLLKATLTGHEGPVVQGVYSPTGAQIATASEDGTARLWSGDGSLLAVLNATAQRCGRSGSARTKDALSRLRRMGRRGSGMSRRAGLSSRSATARRRSAWQCWIPPGTAPQPEASKTTSACACGAWRREPSCTGGRSSAARSWAWHSVGTEARSWPGPRTAGHACGIRAVHSVGWPSSVMVASGQFSFATCT